MQQIRTTYFHSRATWHPRPSITRFAYPERRRWPTLSPMRTRRDTGWRSRRCRSPWTLSPNEECFLYPVRCHGFGSLVSLRWVVLGPRKSIPSFFGGRWGRWKRCPNEGFDSSKTEVVLNREEPVVGPLFRSDSAPRIPSGDRFPSSRSRAGSSESVFRTLRSEPKQRKHRFSRRAREPRRRGRAVSAPRPWPGTPDRARVYRNRARAWPLRE